MQDRETKVSTTPSCHGGREGGHGTGRHQTRQKARGGNSNGRAGGVRGARAKQAAGARLALRSDDGASPEEASS